MQAREVGSEATATQPQGAGELGDGQGAPDDGARERPAFGVSGRQVGRAARLPDPGMLQWLTRKCLRSFE